MESASFCRVGKGGGVWEGIVGWGGICSVPPRRLSPLDYVNTTEVVSFAFSLPRPNFFFFLVVWLDGRRAGSTGMEVGRRGTVAGAVIWAPVAFSPFGWSSLGLETDRVSSMDGCICRWER